MGKMEISTEEIDIILNNTNVKIKSLSVDFLYMSDRGDSTEVDKVPRDSNQCLQFSGGRKARPTT